MSHVVNQRVHTHSHRQFPTLLTDSLQINPEIKLNADHIPDYDEPAAHFSEPLVLLPLIVIPKKKLNSISWLVSHLVSVFNFSLSGSIKFTLNSKKKIQNLEF